MISHAPRKYDCPYCDFLAGKESEYNNLDDIVGRNDSAVAFICPMTWQNNHGNVIVVPVNHYENIYAIPDDTVVAIFSLVKKIAKAIRETYGCSGITIIQRNEPDAGQHVWHLHVHVVPRYSGDGFVEQVQSIFADAKSRAPFAQKLREYLSGSG